jgi:predicted transcriptional regulator
VTYIDELREVIRRLHGVDAKHVESVPVKETFQGRTVWDGVVEVFELIGHPRARRAYAWSHDADGKKRHVTVLHMDKVTSPILAVRAAIVQEFRSAEEI